MTHCLYLCYKHADIIKALLRNESVEEFDLKNPSKQIAITVAIYGALMSIIWLWVFIMLIVVWKTTTNFIRAVAILSLILPVPFLPAVGLIALYRRPKLKK